MKGGLARYGRSAAIWQPHFDRSAAFTIIEVLIVLAVTGALFIAAVFLISGRQNQTVFDQAIRQVQSQIQQALNEVAVGYFPNNGNFQCSAGGNPLLTSGAAGQGSNSGCIFLGKAIQFGVLGTNPENFIIYTLTSLQQDCIGTDEATCLGQVNPVVVAPGITHNSAGYPDNSVSERLQSGLKVARMWYNNGGSDVEIGTVAFLNSLTRSSSGSTLTGTGQVNIVPVSGTSLGVNAATVVERLNADGGDALPSSVINPSGGVYVCFSSGSTDQYGVVKIGGTSRDLAVTLTIKNKNGASCS